MKALQWLAACVVVLSIIPSAIGGTDLTGKAAPEFDLPSTGSGRATLASYKGRWLVLYFYPLSFTPRAVKEACSLRESYGDIDQMGASILGISRDGVATQEAFKAENGLPFDLASDSGKAVARAYEVLGFGNIYPYRTFVIDPDGRIAHIFYSVNVNSHGASVVDVLRQEGVVWGNVAAASVSVQPVDASPASYVEVSYGKLGSPAFVDDYANRLVTFKAVFIGEWGQTAIYERNGVVTKDRVFLNHRDLSYRAAESQLSSTDMMPPLFALSVSKEMSDVVFKLHRGDVVELKGRAVKSRGTLGVKGGLHVYADAISFMGMQPAAGTAATVDTPQVSVPVGASASAGGPPKEDVDPSDVPVIEQPGPADELLRDLEGGQ